jgi:hypothetical protein
MHKKDYEAIARVLREEHEEIEHRQDDYPWRHEVVESICDKLLTEIERRPTLCKILKHARHLDYQDTHGWDPSPDPPPLDTSPYVEPDGKGEDA